MQSVKWIRIVVLSACVILCSVGGNCLVSEGVKSRAGDSGWVSTLVNPLVIGGIVLLMGCMLLRMTLLSITPMSVVLPLTAGMAYLLTSAVGQLLLHEKVGNKGHGLGLALIFVGVVTDGRTRPVLGEMWEIHGHFYFRPVHLIPILSTSPTLTSSLSRS